MKKTKEAPVTDLQVNEIHLSSYLPKYRTGSRKKTDGITYNKS